MSRQWTWLVEALASQHGDEAFHEAYQEIGPPPVPNASLEAFIANRTETTSAPGQPDQRRTTEEPE